MHKTQKSVITKFNVGFEDDKKNHNSLIHSTKKFLFHQIGKKEIQVIEKYFEELKSTLEHNYSNALVHNNLI
ncbi:MAG: hypothetical protein B6U87_02950 [Candidatus Aenigmarchaeota archaeon ex4484_52]|nr:MAG: hypothetical protein B6U87_02950 [Candidatus Aenigmarchaeota archaeon ex4484_52]